MKRLLICLLLIVGCEKDSTSPEPDCMEGNTCAELEVLYNQAVIDYQSASLNSVESAQTIMLNLYDCLQNNCP